MKSTKLPNDETAILEFLAEINTMFGGAVVTSATDLNHSGAGLLIALVVSHDQTLPISRAEPCATRRALIEATVRHSWLWR